MFQTSYGKRSNTSPKKKSKLPAPVLCAVCNAKFARTCAVCKMKVCSKHGKGQRARLCNECAATPSKSSQAPREWRVDNWFDKTFTRDKTETFLIIKEHEFLKLVRYQIQHQRNEDAGLFLVSSEDYLISWLEQHPEDQVSNRTSGSVVASPGALVAKCLIETGKTPNGQWHTHPQFDPYWSAQDREQQRSDVYDAYNLESSGERYFIVIGYGIGITLRHYYWDKELSVAEYRDGFVTLLDSTGENEEYVDLEIKKYKPAKVTGSKNGVTTYYYDPKTSTTKEKDDDPPVGGALDWMKDDDVPDWMKDDWFDDGVVEGDLLTKEEYEKIMYDDAMDEYEYMVGLGFILTENGHWIKSDTLAKRNGNDASR